MTAPLLFLDFDGTISNTDVVDEILQTYADARWLEVEEEWKRGLIGSRECLRAQMALVRATPRELETLLDAVTVDEGVWALLETCARHGIGAQVVSDGFDWCIDRILHRASRTGPPQLLDRVPVYSSHLEYAGGLRWRTAFPCYSNPCVHDCATCKQTVMVTVNDAHAPTVFVGDGLSDKYAAQHADCVFAKDALARYCRERAITHSCFDSLTDVAERIDELMRIGVFATRPRREAIVREGVARTTAPGPTTI